LRGFFHLCTFKNFAFSKTISRGLTQIHTNQAIAPLACCFLAVR
jgi:hypothetical protein